MPKKIDLTGQRFGRLTVIQDTSERKCGCVIWYCSCDCGNKVRITSGNLINKSTKSCGCLQKEIASKTGKLNKHGHYAGNKASPTYFSWRAMKTRCGNPKHDSYKYYGGRGVTVCKRWANSFENFLIDMGERPEGTSLDRIDTNGNYRPDNCKWSTPTEQQHNRRDNIQ